MRPGSAPRRSRGRRPRPPPRPGGGSTSQASRGRRERSLEVAHPVDRLSRILTCAPDSERDHRGVLADDATAEDHDLRREARRGPRRAGCPARRAASRATPRPSAGRAGRRPRSSARAAAAARPVSTVSYATPVIPESSRARVSGSSAAMWRYVKSVRPSRSRGYSGSIGSLTFSRRSRRLPDVVDVGDPRADTPRTPRPRTRMPRPAPVLDDDLVAALDELERACGRQCDAVLLLLDLLRNPDPHGARDDTALPPGDGVTGARGALRRTRRRRTTGPRQGRGPCARAAAARRPLPSP